MPRRTLYASLLVGPLVGSLAAWAVLTGYAFFFPLTPGRFELAGWLSLLIVAVPVGYIFGFLPAVIAGGINAGLADSGLAPGLRIALAVPVGIVTTWMIWFWLILGSPAYNLVVHAAMFTAAGASGSPAAVWWASRPRRARVAVPA